MKSRENYQKELSSESEFYLGMRREVCLSPVLFSMYINAIEDEFYLHGLDDTVKLFSLLYADDITIFFQKLPKDFKRD